MLNNLLSHQQHPPSLRLYPFHPVSGVQLAAGMNLAFQEANAAGGVQQVQCSLSPNNIVTTRKSNVFLRQRCTVGQS